MIIMLVILMILHIAVIIITAVTIKLIVQMMMTWEIAIPALVSGSRASLGVVALPPLYKGGIPHKGKSLIQGNPL